MTDKTENVESVPTHSNDPLLSGENRLKLNELMELCTSLSQIVITLETTKTNQALEIDSLKRRVKKLKKKKGSRTHRLRRLFKVGRSAQVVSSEDEGLGAQEDASKQGRKITDLDADVEVVSTAKVTTASATTTTVDELTLAYTLIDIKAAKPKPVTTASTTTTNSVTRPKSRGVVVQEPTELEEEERLARKKEEDANIAKWNNVQAMIDADYELATRLHAQEQAELTFEEWSKMFVELVDKRKKHFERLRAEEQRRKPPTKAQKRSQMFTYLKHMARYKQNQLKNKNYNEIQKLFDKSMTRVNMFVDMDAELVKESSKKAEIEQESSSKIAGEELESDNSKKQKLDESVKVEVDDEAEMKKHIEIVFDD
ncbi:hypothetical protein Tco_0793555 [Tanacetum coccineum]